MPTIPLYHFQPQGSGTAGVRANPHLLDAQYEGGKQLGEGIASLANPIAKVAQSLQQAKDFKDVSTVDMAMQQEWDAFQATLNPSTDETQWVAQWQKQLDTRLDKVVPKDAAPMLKQELQLRTGQFKVRTSGDVSLQAKGVGVQKGKTIGLARTDQLWRNGEPDAAEANLNQMAKLGFILPEEVPQLVQRGQSRMEGQQATHLIANDPVAAEEALTEKTPSGQWKNFKKLDEDDRLTLLNHARTQTTVMQSGNYQELIDGLNNNDVKQPEALQAMVDKKLITAKQAKSYTAAYRHGGYNTDPAAIGKLFTDLNNYDPQKDPDQTGRAELLGRIATTGFPTNVQSQANELLGKKADANHVLNSPVAKDAFEGIDAMFKLGTFGKYETRKMDPKTGLFSTEVNQNVLQQAMTTKRRIEDATRGYIEANPQATAAEVNKFIYENARGSRMKSIWAPVINPLSGKATK